MKQSMQDPRRVDVLRLASGGLQIDGKATSEVLPRLVADAPLAAGSVVAWRAQGDRREPAGSAPETWLRLQVEAEVVLTCQRCLQPMRAPLAVDRRLRFVRDEAEAERLDEAGDDDVLALPAGGRVDLLELVEDELILALPLVPRHPDCAIPAAGRDRAGSDPAPGRQPFAALAALRGRTAAGGSTDNEGED